jgi:flagellin-specific chaperone FliS
MNTALAYKRSQNQQKGISTYQQNQIMNLSATELILKLYDLAIVAIKQGNVRKANLVITELIASLNFEYKEVALGFFKLYRYCQDQLYKGNLKEPLKIMEDLRATWARAFNLT